MSFMPYRCDNTIMTISIFAPHIVSSSSFFALLYMICSVHLSSSFEYFRRIAHTYTHTHTASQYFICLPGGIKERMSGPRHTIGAKQKLRELLVLLWRVRYGSAC